MKFKHFAAVLAGTVLTPALFAVETVFQGFGKPWEFYSGTVVSKENDSASMPLKSGGMYIGIRQNLRQGLYACSFEYKFAEQPAPNTEFQFSYTGKPALYLNLLPGKEWSSVRFRVANQEDGAVKFGLGIRNAPGNRLELRNFKIERLAEEDFRTVLYPHRTDYWFNRSSDRTNSTLSVERAEDHVLAGEMISLKVGPQFKTDGTLLLMTLSEPLPQGKQYRLTCDLKSDKTGAVRIAVSDNYRTEHIGPEWKKISFEFPRKVTAKLTANVSFQTLSREIRNISVKDLKLEMVDLK